MATAQVAPNGNSKPQAVVTEVTITNNGVKTEKVYYAANDILGEFPVTFIEQVSALAKKKFADDFLTQVSDKDMQGFRTMYLVELISNLHKQHEKMVRERKEKKQREQYKEYRSRGIDKPAAIKLSGYNPDLE